MVWGLRSYIDRIYQQVLEKELALTEYSETEAFV